MVECGVRTGERSFRAGGWKDKKISLVPLAFFLILFPRLLAWAAISKLFSEKLLFGGFFSYLVGIAAAFFLVLLFTYFCKFVAIYAAVVMWGWDILLSILVFGYPLVFLFYGFDIMMEGGRTRFLYSAASVGVRKSSRS